jgi:hypothetical protein
MDPLKKAPASVKSSHAVQSALPRSMFSLEDVRRFVAELEVPFPTSLLEWRVVSTSEGGARGQIAPYADPRAYTDRLNEIFTPAGWTRRYTVTTSANFERSEDKKLVAKVFVTCDLTIHGVGSHSAMGEEWADNDNAGTSAEAQAFKRACSCFGLGRYLYNFNWTWVDLDERQRPKETPQIFGWATPEGWRQGLRPAQPEGDRLKKVASTRKKRANASARKGRDISPETKQTIQQIEEMVEPLGKAMYRGLLKTVARVWKPNEIRDPAVLEKVLTSMQSAAHSFRRLEAARERAGSEAMNEILKSLGIRSLENLNDLETLRQLVLRLEEKADQINSA